MKEYSWRIGGWNFKEDPNEVGKELESLGDNLTPEGVVNKARNENNILHGMFEWDDSIAGENYRKIQASNIINSIQVNIITDDDQTKQIRAFVTIQKNTKFEPIEKVVNDTDKYALLLEKAYKELSGIKRKYETLTEIQELLKDIPE